MTTKQQYADQCRAAHPKPVYATINDVRVELSDDEYEAMIDAWSLMRWYQDNPELQPKGSL